MQFLQNMTHMALTHAASTPNVPTPKGEMSHDKMLSFVSGIASKGLQHFDEGGQAQSQPQSSSWSDRWGQMAKGFGKAEGGVIQRFDTGGTALSGPTTAATGAANTTAGGIGGFVGNILGTNNNFQGQGANVQQGTNTAQLNNAYNQANSGINQQSGFVQQLSSNIQPGIQNQNTLGNMYLAQAQGQGPNPAQAELNQNTGQNIAQQAALAAGTRGAGANAGLIASQNAQQGAATQQAAVGQAATLGAQQQLAAESNLQNLSANEISQNSGALQTLNNEGQNEQNILQGANTAANNATVSSQNNVNTVNAGVAAGNQSSNSNVLSGIGNALSSVPVIGSFFAEGGTVGQDKATAEWKPWARAPKYAPGGVIGQSTAAPQSYVGQWLNSTPNEGQIQQSGPMSNSAPALTPLYEKPDDEKKEGQLSDKDVNDLTASASDLSTGSADLSSSDPSIQRSAHGGKIQKLKSGGDVPGKPKVNRDSYGNDTVKALLSPGEVVMDLNTLKDPGKLGKMARFVAASIERNKAKKQGMK